MPTGPVRLWFPRRRTVPPLGAQFGFYIHPDLYGQRRAEAALRFWRLAADPPVSRAVPVPLDWPRHDPERLALMLWAFDLEQAGLSASEIARIILGAKPGADWADSHTRSKVRRLLKGAEKLVKGGYRELLRPPKRHPGKRRPGRS